MFYRQGNSSMCAVPRKDVKDPTVSLAKRCVIAGTMNKLQVPALTYRGHCISSAAMSTASDATPQPCAAYQTKNDDYTSANLNQPKATVCFQPTSQTVDWKCQWILCCKSTTPSLSSSCKKFFFIIKCILKAPLIKTSTKHWCHSKILSPRLKQ